MENTTIDFSTGNLIVSETSISFHAKSGNIDDANTIGRENIGHADIQEMKVLPKAAIVHCFQLVVAGIIVSIVGFIFGVATNSYVMLYLGVACMLSGGLLFFSYMWIEKLLGVKIATPILLNLFGVEVSKIAVQNIYGKNNLQFLVLKKEASKIPDFQKLKIQKAILKNPSVNSSMDLESLEKLKELKDKGILTLEEFEQKKKKILDI